MSKRLLLALFLGCGTMVICACGAPPSTVALAKDGEPAAAKPPQAGTVYEEGQPAKASPLADPGSTFVWEAGPDHSLESPLFRTFRLERCIQQSRTTYSVGFGMSTEKEFKGRDNVDLVRRSDELASLSIFMRNAVGKRIADTTKVTGSIAYWTVPARMRWNAVLSPSWGINQNDKTITCTYQGASKDCFELTWSQDAHMTIDEDQVEKILAAFTEVLNEVERMRKIKPMLDP